VSEPRLYSELAEWWPLLSPPSEYVEEAADVLGMIRGAVDSPRTLLELGCGGGSLANNLSPNLEMTLTDRSPQMLAQSRRVNPKSEHVLGDMTTIRLNREFDIVLIHDAIMYLTTREKVLAALETARLHCRPNGAVIVLPDYVRETFTSQTSHGGEDAPDGRGLRYLEWTWDPDPSDTTYEVAFAFLLREPDFSFRVERDHHVEGLFSRAEWQEMFRDAGLAVKTRMDPWDRDTFIAKRV